MIKNTVCGKKTLVKLSRKEIVIESILGDNKVTLSKFILGSKAEIA
jgi:hypothetical protein